MSISWEDVGASLAGEPASRALAGKFLASVWQRCHQLGRSGRSLGREASIMSISSDGLGASWAGEPAS